MSFSSRRRNYLLVPHRRDGLIEWMKSMLQHSFVLDALETTGADTFSHFEILINEHRRMSEQNNQQVSRLQQLVPTIGMFHTHLPLRRAFEVYNEKHKLTKRQHIQISFNEIRHILNLAQIMALRKNVPGERRHPLDIFAPELEPNSFVSCRKSDDVEIADGDSTVDKDIPPGQLNGPRLITFDGDQTLYADGANFDSNPRLANYLYLLLRHGVSVAVVTAAGYEYNVEKYEYRLSGLLHFFRQRGLSNAECARFYLFGGECNYLFQLGHGYRLQPVKEYGPSGWITSTSFIKESPGNWSEAQITPVLDVAESNAIETLTELNLRGRIVRKRRSVGLCPNPGQEIPRESLDELVLRSHEKLNRMNEGNGPGIPYCAFNGGTDAWVDVGNKRVGVQVLQSYLGIPVQETLHIGDQFLNTGNDYAARDVSCCVWIISPQETTYILKLILRLAGVSVILPDENGKNDGVSSSDDRSDSGERQSMKIDFGEIQRRSQVVQHMDVYTGDLIQK
jgi:IMP and pyridine-specific 5'-nucleotidase